MSPCRLPQVYSELNHRKPLAGHQSASALSSGSSDPYGSGGPHGDSTLQQGQADPGSPGMWVRVRRADFISKAASDECVICFRKLDDPVGLGCGHSMCSRHYAGSLPGELERRRPHAQATPGPASELEQANCGINPFIGKFASFLLNLFTTELCFQIPKSPNRLHRSLSRPARQLCRLWVSLPLLFRLLYSSIFRKEILLSNLTGLGSSPPQATPPTMATPPVDIAVPNNGEYSLIELVIKLTLVSRRSPFYFSSNSVFVWASNSSAEHIKPPASSSHFNTSPQLLCHHHLAITRLPRSSQYNVDGHRTLRTPFCDLDPLQHHRSTRNRDATRTPFFKRRLAFRIGRPSTSQRCANKRWRHFGGLDFNSSRSRGPGLRPTRALSTGVNCTTAGYSSRRCPNGGSAPGSISNVPNNAASGSSAPKQHT